MDLPHFRPSEQDVLQCIDHSIQSLRAEEVEARFIVLGPAAYARLQRAMATRFKRPIGTWETYQGIAIVIDPSRTDEVVVLPGPTETAQGVQLYAV